jgi:hypothetical protein
MSRKSADLLVVTTLIVLLAGWSTAQAFSFCFSFGGGSNNRSDFYNRPPPAVGFGPGVYQVYPYSPVVAAPLYRPYYPPSPPPGFYGGSTPQSPESE